MSFERNKTAQKMACKRFCLSFHRPETNHGYNSILTFLFSKMVTHLLRTHLFMEPIAVATYRQLPTLHPLFKLLSPHIRGVLAINTLGRDVLIAEGGVADNTLTVGGGGNFFKKNHSCPGTAVLPDKSRELFRECYQVYK